MAQEKALLLQDLCTKLPYGVKIWYKYFKHSNFIPFATSIRLAEGKIALSRLFNKEGDWFPIEEASEILIKPYLRSLSSMTEAEKIIYQSKQSIVFDFNNHKLYVDNHYSLDYLDSIRVDHRGLIERGIAFEAPEDMYV